MVNRPVQHMGGRDEVGIEDEHKFPRSRSQTCRQRTGFKARALRAMLVVDIEPVALQLLAALTRFLVCCIGGVIEHLHL